MPNMHACIFLVFGNKDSMDVTLMLRFIHQYLQLGEERVLPYKILFACYLMLPTLTVTSNRSLVLGPTAEVDATIRLLTLSRQSKAYLLAERTLLDPLAWMGIPIDS